MPAGIHAARRLFNAQLQLVNTQRSQLFGGGGGAEGGAGGAGLTGAVPLPLGMGGYSQPCRLGSRCQVLPLSIEVRILLVFDSVL